jgi:hypothetical protein
MRIMKKGSTHNLKVSEHTSKDPILRRIKVQNTIIKKMLMEIDLQSKPVGDSKSDDMINYPSIDLEENENQEP